MPAGINTFTMYHLKIFNLFSFYLAWLQAKDVKGEGLCEGLVILRPGENQ